MIDIIKHIIEYSVNRFGGADVTFVLNLIKTPNMSPGKIQTNPTIVCGIDQKL